MLTINEQAVDVLTYARAKISAPESWLQGNAAMTAYGVEVSPGETSAVRFCALGAVSAIGFANPAYAPKRIGDSNALAFANEYLAMAIPADWRRPASDGVSAGAGAGKHGVDAVSAYNDAPERTHADVMRWFDDAIGIARRDADGIWRTLAGAGDDDGAGGNAYPAHAVAVNPPEFYR